VEDCVKQQPRPPTPRDSPAKAIIKRGAVAGRSRSIARTSSRGNTTAVRDTKQRAQPAAEAPAPAPAAPAPAPAPPTPPAVREAAQAATALYYKPLIQWRTALLRDSAHGASAFSLGITNSTLLKIAKTAATAVQEGRCAVSGSGGGDGSTTSSMPLATPGLGLGLEVLLASGMSAATTKQHGDAVLRTLAAC
jgi:hypothetical protein